ncbi:hypothetical protein ACKVWC_011448 [Pyricularia oryzae]
MLPPTCIGPKPLPTSLWPVYSSTYREILAYRTFSIAIDGGGLAEGGMSENGGIDLDDATVNAGGARAEV